MSLIGGETVVNRRGKCVDRKCETKVDSSKVPRAEADEVVERGAFRIVNRISHADVSAI
jgi:hypothetical protein